MTRSFDIKSLRPLPNGNYFFYKIYDKATRTGTFKVLTMLTGEEYWSDVRVNNFLEKNNCPPNKNVLSLTKLNKGSIALAWVYLDLDNLRNQD